MKQELKLQLLKQALLKSRKQRILMHYKMHAKNDNYQPKIKLGEYTKPDTFSNENGV